MSHIITSSLEQEVYSHSLVVCSPKVPFHELFPVVPVNEGQTFPEVLSRDNLNTFVKKSSTMNRNLGIIENAIGASIRQGMVVEAAIKIEQPEVQAPRSTGKKRAEIVDDDNDLQSKRDKKHGKANQSKAHAGNSKAKASGTASAKSSASRSKAPNVSVKREFTNEDYEAETQPSSKRGKKSSHFKENQELLEERKSRVSVDISMIEQLLIWNESKHPRVRKRAIGKQASSDVADSQQSIIRNKIAYEPQARWLSRSIATNNVAWQRMSKVFQLSLFPDVCVFEVNNACITLTKQLLEHIQLDNDIKAAFEPELTLLREMSDSLEDIVQNKLKMSEKEGEAAIIKVLCGAKSFPTTTLTPEAEQFWSTLSRLSRFLRWVAMSWMNSDFATLLEDWQNKTPEVSIFNYFWQTAETHVCRTFTDFILTTPVSHVSKGFHSMCVDRSRALYHNEQSTDLTEMELYENFCSRAAAYIQRTSPSFDLAIIRKQYFTFGELVEQYALKNTFQCGPYPFYDSFSFEQRMNTCIFIACAQLMEDVSSVVHTISAWKYKLPSEDYIPTYGEVFSLLEINVVPHLMIDLSNQGKWIIHQETVTGSHARAIDISAERRCTLWTDSKKVGMQASTLKDMLESCVEYDNMVAFKIVDAAGDYEHPLNDLLTLRAGMQTDVDSSADHLEVQQDSLSNDGMTGAHDATTFGRDLMTAAISFTPEFRRFSIRWMRLLCDMDMTYLHQNYFRMKGVGLEDSSMNRQEKWEHLVTSGLWAKGRPEGKAKNRIYPIVEFNVCMPEKVILQGHYLQIKENKYKN